MNGVSKLVVVTQGRFPEVNVNVGTRRALDFATGMNAIGEPSKLWSPAYFFESSPSDYFAGRVHQLLGPNRRKAKGRDRLRFWDAVVKEAKKNPPQTILFYNTTVDSCTAMMRLRRNGFRVAYELSDRHSLDTPSLKKKVVHLLAERLLPRLSDVNVSISHGLAAWMSSVSPKTPCLILPGFVDQAVFRPNGEEGLRFREKYQIPEDALIVGYAGSWYPHKGLQSLFQAFKSVLKVVESDVRLVVTGPPNQGPDAEDPIKLRQEYDLQDRVFLPGSLSPADVFGLMNAADVLAAPSLRHDFNENAFPTKVAEYASIGRPLLLTAVGDIPKYFTHNQSALVAEPGNVEGLAKGLVSLLSSPDYRKTISMGAMEVAQDHFNLLKCMQRFRNFLDTKSPPVAQG